MTGPGPYDSPDFDTPEQEAEAHWQAADEAMYGTPDEQAAEAAVDQAEAIVSGAFGGYLTGTYIIPGLDSPDEPEAEL